MDYKITLSDMFTYEMIMYNYMFVAIMLHWIDCHVGSTDVIAVDCSGSGEMNTKIM